MVKMNGKKMYFIGTDYVVRFPANDIAYKNSGCSKWKCQAQWKKSNGEFQLWGTDIFDMYISLAKTKAYNNLHTNPSWNDF